MSFRIFILSASETTSFYLSCVSRERLVVDFFSRIRDFGVLLPSTANIFSVSSANVGMAALVFHLCLIYLLKKVVYYSILHKLNFISVYYLGFSWPKNGRLDFRG